ncbi:MAG TPA: S8 family serine peptidase [Azospirillum sp.]|nr:S8 family serine peptidase [Azospirillum sp.]
MRRFQRPLAAVTAVALIFGAVPPLGIAEAWAANASGVTQGGAPLDARLEAWLRHASPNDLVPVIIDHVERPDPHAAVDGSATKEKAHRQVIDALRSKAAVDLPPLADALARQGASDIKQLWISNSIVARVPARLVAALARQPDVGSVRLDETLRAVPPTYSLSSTAVPSWNIAGVNAPNLWSLGFTGQGTVVGLMETGVDAAHPDLKDRWRGGTNSWFDPHGEHATPYDASGHGTNVASLAVGGSASGTAVGVAPGAKWIAAKIFNDAGEAQLSQVHQAFQWMLSPDGDAATADAPQVVNASWNLLGTTGLCDQEFATDIQALRAAEIAVVFSAGNEGPYAGTSVSPANNAGTLAVGAIDANNAVADFSSRGPTACTAATPYPSLVAPGVDVRAADLTYDGTIPSSYSYISGASASAPHVAGAMALLLSAFPGLKVAELEGLLTRSALDLGVTGTDPVAGAGKLDVMAAYNLKANGAGPESSIKVVTVLWNARTKVLTVEASSALGKAGNLQLVGFGKMTWNARKSLWTLSVRASAKPISITVTGPEGTVTVSTSDYGV